jgi:hypothetical protein
MTLINHLRGEQVLSDPEGKVAKHNYLFRICLIWLDRIWQNAPWK